jgi:hypothetical protein
MKIKVPEGKHVLMDVDKLIDFLSKFESEKVLFIRKGKVLQIADADSFDDEEDEEEND